MDSNIQKRMLINIVLTGSILALMLILWFHPYEPPAQALTKLDKQSVTALQLQFIDRAAISLQRTAAGTWQLQSPIQIAADSMRVNGFLNILSATSVEQYMVAEQELSDYGLASPLATVVINNNALKLQFGANAPLSNRRYVLLADTVHLIDDVALSIFGSATQ